MARFVGRSMHLRPPCLHLTPPPSFTTSNTHYLNPNPTIPHRRTSSTSAAASPTRCRPPSPCPRSSSPTPVDACPCGPSGGRRKRRMWWMLRRCCGTIMVRCDGGGIEIGPSAPLIQPNNPQKHTHSRVPRRATPFHRSCSHLRSGHEPPALPLPGGHVRARGISAAAASPGGVPTVSAFNRSV